MQFKRKFKTTWQRLNKYFENWLGVEHIRQNGWRHIDRTKSLKDQINRLKYIVSLKNRLLALSIRIVVLFFFLVSTIDDFFYSTANTVTKKFIFVVVVFYLCYVCYLTKNLFRQKLNILQSSIKITLEILFIFYVIWFLPINAPFLQAGSTNIFLAIIIIIAPLSGRWWLGLYAGVLIALISYVLSFAYYNDFISAFDSIPIHKHKWVSIYYTLTGCIISVIFYLFFKNQELSFDLKVGSLISRTYFDLCLSDLKKFTFGKYVIQKKSFFPDQIVGADFVAVKENKDGSLNLIIGDSIGHGINRSPGAVATMSAFKAIESSNPVNILQKLNTVLKQINYQYGGSALALVFRLDKAGYIEFAGKLEDFEYIDLKKLTHETITTKGKILGIHENYNDVKLYRKPMDKNKVIIVETDGAKSNNIEDDQTIVSISWND